MNNTRKKGFDWNKKQLPDDQSSLQKIIHEATKKLKSIELKRYNAKHGIINSTVTFRSVGNYGDLDKYGDTLFPGGFVTWNRGGEYNGLKREIPTKFIIDHNPSPVNWLGPIMDEFSVKSELLKLDEHGTTYQPMTEDEKQNLKNSWHDLVLYKYNNDPIYKAGKEIEYKNIRSKQILSEPIHEVKPNNNNNPMDNSVDYYSNGKLIGNSKDYPEYGPYQTPNDCRLDVTPDGGHNYIAHGSRVYEFICTKCGDIKYIGI